MVSWSTKVMSWLGWVLSRRLWEESTSKFCRTSWLSVWSSCLLAGCQLGFVFSCWRLFTLCGSIFKWVMVHWVLMFGIWFPSVFLFLGNWRKLCAFKGLYDQIGFIRKISIFWGQLTRDFNYNCRSFSQQCLDKCLNNLGTDIFLGGGVAFHTPLSHSLA